MAKLERLITPKGVKNITENGEYEIASYESVDVDVEGKVEIPQVSNLAIDEDGILTFDLPDYSELEQYNPTISYIININDNVLETSGNSANVKEYANEGENNVVVITKVAINGLGKDGVVEYVPSEEGKYTIITLNLNDETLLQPTIYIRGFKGTYTIDWGDGNVETYTSKKLTDEMACKKTTTYGTIGVYTIKVLVDYTSLYNEDRYIFLNSSYKKFIVSWEFQQGIYNAIGYEAFYQTLFTSFIVPEGITSIKTRGFSSTKLESIDLPTTLTSIGDTGLGYNYQLKQISTNKNNWLQNNELTIPEGITTIETKALYNVKITENVTLILPSTITTLGFHIFKYNSAAPINKIIIKAKIPPTINSNSFIHDIAGSVFNIEIVVPPESLEAYKTATNWTNFTNIVADTEG